jgi:2-isopropylmalate synthase
MRKQIKIGQRHVEVGQDEWSDHRKSWSTVGVSDNVIVASWNALVDAIRLELMRLTEQDDSIEKAVEDYCWGV